MSIKYKITSALFISLIIMGIVLLSSNKKSDINKIRLIQLPVQKCIPQERMCEIKINDTEVRVSFEKDIFYLKPFKVSLFSNNKIDAVYLDFKMRNMDMGVNRFLLASTDLQNKNWQGKGLLPICVTGRADWNSELEIIIDTKKYIVPFPLIVKQATR